MGFPVIKSNQKFSYRDYLSWTKPGERWELIHGEAFDMSPAPARIHQDISEKLSRIIGNFLDGKPCKIYYAPIDVRLPDNQDDLDEDIETVIQPDIVIICDPSKLDDKGVRGAPDWIIEILSPSTEKRDYNDKYYLYEKYGVKEYWIVNPLSKMVYIYYLNLERKFEEKAILEKKGIAECFVLKGLIINIEEIFK